MDITTFHSLDTRRNSSTKIIIIIIFFKYCYIKAKSHYVAVAKLTSSAGRQEEIPFPRVRPAMIHIHLALIGTYVTWKVRPKSTPPTKNIRFI